jgi:hypothetical protein
VPHPLDDAKLRFARADFHLTEADRVVKAFARICEDYIVASDDGKTMTWPRGWPDVPVELMVVIGDAVHNLRASLDYLIYELAINDSGVVQQNTQFLIEYVKSDPDDPKRGFDARSKKCLKGLSQAHIDAIEMAQPYKGVAWTKALARISNEDKHKKLALLSHKGRHIMASMRHHPFGKYPGELKLGSDGKPFHDRFDIEFDAYHTIGVAGSDPSEPSIMKTLRAIQSGVSHTISAFDGEFKPRP